MNTPKLEPKKWPENDKIKAIAAQSALNLIDLITVHETEIQAVLCEQEEGPVTLSHSIVIDLGKNVHADKLSFSLKTKDEISGPIPDPSQPELPGVKGGEAA